MFFINILFASPDRDKIKTGLEKKNIGSAIYYPISLEKQKHIKIFIYTEKNRFPKSNKLTKLCLSLPMFPHLSENDVLIVCNAIKNKMSISKKILIIAGEESGDMYGANIIQKLSKNQNYTFYAMGSSKMQMTNAKIIVDSSKLSVVGFFEILRIYPNFKCINKNQKISR